MRTAPKYLIAGLLAVALWAQEPTKPAEQAKPADTKPAAAEAPPGELPGRFDVEVGYRWNQGIQGNSDSYRSVVNLGEGPRLLNWDIETDVSPLKFARKLELRGGGWGGDPASWLRFGLEDNRFYRFLLSHRDTAYFNSLPSFANPQLEAGVLFSQRSFDINRKLTEAQVDLFPAGVFTPYFAFSRDRGAGRGVSVFVANQNEYPVLSVYDDRANMYRTGFHYQARRAHATLETGIIRFNDDQTLSTSDRNSGNRTTPVLGQQLFLSDVLQAYDVRGSSHFYKGLFTAQPMRWLDFSGAFQFSQPSSDTTYNQRNTGRFFDPATLAFFNAQNLRLLGAAKQPHITANLGMEIRPQSRLRVITSWTTDRLHNAASIENTIFADRLEWTYNQYQAEVIVEPRTRLTLRGGYRYTGGDGRTRGGITFPLAFESGELERHTGLAGAGYRVTDRLSINSDVEIARSEKALFRISLTDYERIRVRGRYLLTSRLQAYGTFQYLNNENPPKFNRYEFRNQIVSAGLHYMPATARGLSLLGEYARSAIRSDLDFRVPQTLEFSRSQYRENAHTITALADVPLAIGWTWQPHLSVGGSAFLSAGSRPYRFYQPVARFSAPLHRRLDVVAEYRWYGAAQPFYVFEGFRSHLGFVGLRFH